LKRNCVFQKELKRLKTKTKCQTFPTMACIKLQN
jgi:hypothetical protein